MGKKILLLFLILFSYCLDGFSQRYNFEQYDIEDGLTQSQVTAITQDSKRRLWISTLGGLSCFNGKQFTDYTKIRGLSSNFILALASGKKDEIWIGSAKGLSKYDGKGFSNSADTKKWVGALATDKNGTTYCIKAKRLYNANKDQLITISNDTTEIVTALKTDYSGNIWVAVHGKGLYQLEKGKWTLWPLDEKIKTLIVTNILVDKLNKGKVWFLTPQGIYVAQNNNINKVYNEITSKCNAIAQDGKGSIWIGTNKGAYYITPASVIHFNSQNGFTDNVVNEIFKDVENNIWLGTDGSGLFRFTNNSYVTFDETQGIESRIVMAIANGPTPGSIWLGSYGGLYEYKQNQKITNVKIPSQNPDSYRINFLYNDHKNNLWVGTPGGGLWKHNGKRLERMDTDNLHIAYNAMIEDSGGTIWLSTNHGCLTFDVNSKKFTRITQQFGGGLMELARDSIILGTQDGAWLVANKKMLTPLKIKGLSGSNILCMLKYKDYVLFGTADYGLVIWNIKTGATKSLNTKSGLASDHIYSLLEDKKGIIWVGTGRGIDRIDPKNFTIIPPQSEDELLVECNQNAILQHNNNVWIGTTKGVIVYGVNPNPEKKVSPYIYINSVNVTPNYKPKYVEGVLTLPYNHNRINISYTGIYLKNPDAVMYQYRLIGLDNKFSQPSSNSSMNFTAIPPGKYTFQVKVITKDGLFSVNTASVAFEILPAYYQTSLFKFFIVILIILLILFIVYIILMLNERRRKLRLKIKLEEQFKIRKQTAEDFHDDLGNKLTRITVLSEVLGSMIDKDDTEKRNILKKIRCNVDELYNGTKDILWSLNPKNDSLEQVLNHIKDFGQEMVNETPILFKFDIDLNNKYTKLSLDMSRNILMIFKESIHNSLKHAKARVINFEAKLNNGMLLITLQDDGIGFDVAHAKDGHGMNNMYVRAKRINADLKIISNDNGTSVLLLVNFSTLKHFKDA
ncbi:two-component regulator propeller domain-containing protein [Pedobacter panaciterrae]|uniref:Two-component regulator propeller domain-containing protein n=1 Tax=Pedobacter panaciterrae TaxID=363849 RepID=A0ABU8NGC4_9SPHI